MSVFYYVLFVFCLFFVFILCLLLSIACVSGLSILDCLFSVPFTFIHTLFRPKCTSQNFHRVVENIKLDDI